MKPLNLRDAIQLYKIIGKYLPEDSEDDLDFIGKIVSSIKEGNQRDYVDAISLMTKHNVSKLLEKPPEKVLNLFIEGLSINRITELKAFSERIGL